MPSTRSSAANAPPPHAPLSEAIGIVMVCFGYFIFSALAMLANWPPDRFTGLSDNAIGGMLGMELILGAMALLLLWGRGYPLSQLWPKPSWRGVVEGGALFVCALLAYKLIMLAVPHARPTLYDEARADLTASAPCIVLLVVVHAVYEEAFLLAYLMRGLRRYGASTALGIALLVRLLYQAVPDPAGVAAMMTMGVLFALYFQRRNALFPVVLAQTGFNLMLLLGPGM